MNVLAFAWCGAATLAIQDPLEPVGLAAAGSDRVLVACAGGEIVQLEGRQVTETRRVAASLADLVALGADRFAAADPVAGEVLVLRSDGEVVARHAVRAPSSVAAVGELLVAASGSERSLTVLSARGVTGEVELPFAPGAMSWSQNADRLFVADAFGGALAEIDTESWQLVAVRETAGHNLRGMAFDRDGALLIAHQVLDPLAHASFDDVHWGNLVRNVVRVIPAGGEEHVLQLGDVGRGAGDPASVAVDAHGRLVIALAGTGELLVRDRQSGEERRFPVGHRPVATLVQPDGTVVVANSLGRSVSFVDTEKASVDTVPIGPPLADDAVARGRRLFFDARLSHDGWMSCHSCHTDGHSPGRLADTMGDGTHGTPKRVLSLRGVGDTAPYAWNGSQPTLEAQVEKSLRTTMHADAVEPQQVRDLVAFLRTLPPPAARAAPHDEVVARGRELFDSSGCADCHVPPLFTSPDTFSVGVTDEAGASEFNPPSLRGVGTRARLFHDGRYRRLEPLIARADHPGTEELDERGIAAVVAYLRTL